jgi:hypothetical protein
VVEPLTFRFSGVGIAVRRIPLTSATCMAALIWTLMNAGERRWMRPKMRPPGFGCCPAETFASGGTPDNGMEHKLARDTRLWSLVLAALPVACKRSLFGSILAIWMCFVTVKCPNDQRFCVITDDLGRRVSCAILSVWRSPTTRQSGGSLDGTDACVVWLCPRADAW